MLSSRVRTILLRLIPFDPIPYPQGHEMHLPGKLKRVPKRLLHVGPTRVGIFNRRSIRTRTGSGPTRLPCQHLSIVELY
jgi:hypothetical protein